MAYTQADADALRAAIATGAKSVTFGGRTTVYRDMDELRDVLVAIESELAAATGTATQRLRLGYQAGKGL